MFEFVENVLYLPVISAKSGKLSRTDGTRVTSAVRAIRNCAFTHFYPSNPVFILDYDKVREDAQRFAGKAQAKASTPVDVAAIINAYIEKELKASVFYRYEDVEGVIYDAHAEWNGVELVVSMGGSMTKKAMVIGLPKDIADFPHDWGLFQTAEDIVRGSRLFFSNSRYGGVMFDKSTTRIGFARPGYEVKDYIIEDGAGLIRRSLAEEIYLGQKVQDRKILLGKAKQNYQVSCRYEWADIAPEIAPKVEENILWKEDPEKLRTRAFADLHTLEDWIALEPLLQGHPMATKALTNQTVRFMSELGTSLPLDGVARVAIPCKEVIMPGVGTWQAIRYPVDSFGNIRAFETEDQKKVDWINAQEVLQHSFVSPEMGGKGNLVIVDDAIMDELGLDILFCSEDVKVMRDVTLGTFRKNVEEDGIVIWKLEEDLYFGILQWWGPGSCFAIPYELWVLLGGDFDGDMAILNNITGLPLLIEATKNLPEQESHKIPKTSNEWWQRYTMLTYAMVNGVGFATNLVTSVLAGGPKYAEDVVVNLLPRNSIAADPVIKGHLNGTAEGLWKETNRWIKVCTDGFKRMLNVPKLVQYLFTLQSIISGHFGGMAPWTSWGQDRNTYAFRRGLPEFEWQIAENDPAFYGDCISGVGNVKNLARGGWRWKSRITSLQESSTPARIYAIAQPFLQEWLDYFSTNGVSPLIADITCTPLSEFANWAVMVENNDIQKADALYDMYLALIGNVNWSDADDEFSSVMSFKVKWQDTCSKWASQFSSRAYAASVLWRRAHMSTSDESRAAAPFYGFPEEVRQIVVDKPGLKEKGKQYMSVLVGLDYNFVQAPRELSGAHVEVVTATVKNMRRTVVVATRWIEGMKSASYEYPEFTIGTISKLDARDFRDGFSVPPPGEYSMDLRRAGSRGKAWFAWFSPLDKPSR